MKRISVLMTTIMVALAVPAVSQAKKHSPVRASVVRQIDRTMMTEVRKHFHNAHLVSGATQTVMLKNYYSHLCMGIHYASTNPGALVYQGTCKATAADQWWVIQFINGIGSAGVWEMINYHSHLCLSFNNDSFSNGTAIVQYYCNIYQQYDQVWFNSPTSASWFFVYHGVIMTNPSAVVEDRGFATTAAPLDEWGYWGGANQKWYKGQF